MGDSQRTTLLRVLAWSTLFAITVLIGRATRVDGSQVALVWPAAGIAFLWIRDSWHRRHALALSLGLVVTVSVGLNVLTGSPLWLAALFGVANAVQAVVAVLVLARVTRGNGLDRPRDVLALIVAAVAASVCSGVLGAVGGAAANDLAVLPVLGQWILRNTVGTFVVGAVGIRVLTPPHQRLPAPASAGEQVLVGLGLTAAYLTFFFWSGGLPVAFAVVPLSAWLALRLTTTTAAWHVLPLAAAVVLATRIGAGPFGSYDPWLQALLAQGFVLVVAGQSMLVALGRDDTLRLNRRLDAANDDLVQQAALLTTVYESTHDGLLVLDQDGATTIMNPAAASLFGGAPDDASRAAWEARYRITHVDGSDFPQDEWPASRALRGETVVAVDMVVSTPSMDEPQVVSVNAVPLVDGAGRNRGVVVSLREVTARRRQAAEIRGARDLFRGVLDAATEQSIIGTDVDGTITVFNRGAERMLGYTADEMGDRTPSALHDETEVAARAAELGIEPGFGVFTHVPRAHGHETRRWTYVRKDGRRIDAQLTVSAMRGAEGEVIGYIGVATDVTDQLAAQRDLADSEARFRQVFEHAPVGMLILDPTDGAVLRSNPSFARFVGRSPSTLVGRRFAHLVNEQDRATSMAQILDLASGDADAPWSELGFLQVDGTQVWGTTSASLVAGTRGRSQIVVLVQDVTARRLAEKTLAHQALHDALTGLPNRVLFHDRLEHALAAARRDGTHTGVLFIDLDEFKAVNDTGGHAVGDEVLRQVANGLREAVRPGDTVARLSGDEFAVVAPGLADPVALKIIGERIRGAVAGCVVTSPAGVFTVSASVGASVAQPGRTADQLVQDADSAMYTAKKGGRNRVSCVDPAEQARSARVARLLPELDHAIATDALVMHGQPVVDLASGRALGVETLIRWRHPVRGLLAPSEFLDVLENSARMPDVGRRVLDESLRIAAGLTAQGLGTPTVNVNVSGRQLETGHFTRDVIEAMERHSLPGGRLVLELTETYVPMIANSLRRDLERLRDLGVRVAIDDLGTGYSSLARLTQLPVDVLKIDRQFVAGLETEAGCRAIVGAVVGIGTTLGLSVVAEGIETPQQAALLQDMGVRIGQGFLFSRPLEEAALGPWLAANGLVPAAAPVGSS